MPENDHSRRRRLGYRVIILDGLWRGYDVHVEPPTSTHLPRHFRAHNDTLSWAAEIERTEGWPVTGKSEVGA